MSTRDRTIEQIREDAIRIIVKSQHEAEALARQKQPTIDRANNDYKERIRGTQQENNGLEYTFLIQVGNNEPKLWSEYLPKSANSSENINSEYVIQTIPDGFVFNNDPDNGMFWFGDSPGPWVYGVIDDDFSGVTTPDGQRWELVGLDLVRVK